MEQIGSRAERMGLMANAGIYLYSATRLEVLARHLPVRCCCCRASLQQVYDTWVSMP